MQSPLSSTAGAGRSLDVPSLAAYLRDYGQMEAAGGLAFVAGLPDQCGSFESHLAVVLDKASRRKLLELVALAQSSANDPACDMAAAIVDYGAAVLFVSAMPKQPCPPRPPAPGPAHRRQQLQPTPTGQMADVLSVRLKENGPAHTSQALQEE